jgi:hypothetical protein
VIPVVSRGTEDGPRDNYVGNTTLLAPFQKIPHCWHHSKKYHTVGTIPKSYIKIIEIGKIDTPNTQIHEIPLIHKYMRYP